MKNFLFLMFCCTIFSVQIFCQEIVPGEFNGQVVFSSVEKNGTITLQSTGFGKKKTESISNALAGAFYNLLFRGIPGSPYDLPMIPDENEKKNNPLIKALLEGGYTAFIVENKFISEENKKRKQDGSKGKQTINKITINCDALRKHLEQNGLIRKFGI